MQGTMLWFNRVKGHGFIRTEEGERLYVAVGGFMPGHAPGLRCKGRAVTFERHVAQGESRAVNVSFVTQADPRRARLRHARGGRSL
jgi:cold shock CspA family protein